MAATMQTTFTETDVVAEIDDERASLVQALTVALPLLGWLWLYYSLTRNWSPLEPSVPMLVLCGAAYGAHRLRQTRLDAACRLIVAGMVIALCSVVYAHPAILTMTFGVLGVIMANALLGARDAALTAAVTAALGAAAYRIATGQPVSTGGEAEVLALYALVAAANWLASRPLRNSVESALTGWARARDALVEVRERKGELYRVVRALEEASYRIDRMNHDLIAARREAEEARALKSRFVATVSHELRGPLNLILGFSRLMSLSPKSYEEPLPRCYRADIYTIYRNCQHLVALVDDILDLSQIEAQRLPLVKDRINLDEDVIQRAVAIVESLAARKGLWMRVEVERDLPWVLADSVRLRQALLNLLSNAVRLTAKGGITVRAAARDDAVVVSVQDTGPGIAHDDIPRLFQEFTQVSATPSGKAEGSGLGLAISKQLVQLHGGDIWVESEQGAGTTFAFSVPLPGAVAGSAGTVRTGDGRQVSVAQHCLVVHDDPDVVRILARHITGYRVIGVPPERDIVSLILDLHPRAIIATPASLDAVRAQLELTPFVVPIIVCALPHIHEREDLGSIVGYLVKPLLPEALTAILKRIEREDETTVLLVDDDPDAVRLMERTLTALPQPYRLLKAYDGTEALRVMRGQRPDVVLLDLVMPGMNGEGVLRAMREDASLSDIPVAVISGRDWLTGSVSMGSSLAVEYRRPIQLSEAITAMEALLDALSPDYLPDEAAAQPSGEGLPG